MNLWEPSWTEGPKGKAARPFLQLLRQIDPNTQCERTFEWLWLPRSSERTHMEGQVFEALIAHCRATRHKHPVKALCDPDGLLRDETIRARSRILEIDFFLPSLGVAIEFDERQHFTEERAVTLDFLEGFSFQPRWKSLCSPKIIDPAPPCRDWIRAFRDFVRDVRSSANSQTLLRVYYKDWDARACEAPDALNRLGKLLGGSTHLRDVGSFSSPCRSGRSSTE